MMFSVTILVPIPLALLYADGQSLAFLIGFLVNLATGALLWYPARNNRKELRLRDGFLVVVGFWVVLGGFACVPFLVSSANMSFTDAIFESMSGLTTTGATIITDLSVIPKSILFYRQQLQWFGGMGIIVLAVAILPMLGVGGMQLYKAETPGPMKDSKLTPRITETAKALWIIYLGLTVTCAISYWLAGMSIFDAICHSFSTVAIGGFSPYDASMGQFAEQPQIKLVCIVFMLLAGMNFALHFMSFRSYNFKTYLQDAEWRTYMKILLGMSAVTVLIVWGWEYYSAAADVSLDYFNSAVDSVFQVVSFATTTGFSTVTQTSYPILIPMLLVSASFIGGCAGSTGGGMKVVRILLLAKQGTREIKRLIHPNAQLPVKLGDRSVSERVVESVWGFFSIYIALFGIMFLAMITILTVGSDATTASDSVIVTAFSAVAACMNNLGPGLGSVASNFESVPALGKWILVFAMLLGRLEIFTLLALLTPAFWRK